MLFFHRPNAFHYDDKAYDDIIGINKDYIVWIAPHKFLDGTTVGTAIYMEGENFTFVREIFDEVKDMICGNY